jgi:uncharacterized protein (TIGR02246 family)
MRKKVFLPTLMFFLLPGFNTPAQSTEPGHPMNTDEKQVLDTVLSMTRAFENRDIEGVLAYYDHDAVIAFTPGTATSGAMEIRDQFIQFFAINPAFDYGGHKVFVADDTALHIAPWTMQGTAPDGTQINDNGLSVSVLKRTNGNVWRIIRDDPYGGLLAQ